MSEPAHDEAELAELAELLFCRLGADHGNWRIELQATDGRLRRWRREQEGGRPELARLMPERAASG